MSAVRLLLLLVALLGAAALFGHDVRADQIVRAPVLIRTKGAPFTVYNWSKSRCGDAYIFDAPVRALRNADRTITLTAGWMTNWLLTGKDLESLKPICRSILQSPNVDREGGYWIEALFSAQAGIIDAIVSNDLSAPAKHAECSSRPAKELCWKNRLLLARSSDGGASFSLVEGDGGVLATVSNVYPDDAHGRIGAFTASNVVHLDGQLYFMSWVGYSKPHDEGNCLFRRNSAGVWLAWDGSEFSVDMRKQSERRCKFLSRDALPREVRSLTYSREAGTWIAVFAAQLPGGSDDKPRSGFYYSLSNNLIDWSLPAFIYGGPVVPREGGLDYVYMYPSLIDMHDASPFFEESNGEACIFFTLHHLVRGNGTMNRDLQCLPVSIGRQ